MEIETVMKHACINPLTNELVLLSMQLEKERAVYWKNKMYVDRIAYLAKHQSYGGYLNEYI